MINENEPKQQNPIMDEEDWGRYDDDEWQASRPQKDDVRSSVSKKTDWVSDEFLWQVWKC